MRDNLNVLFYGLVECLALFPVLLGLAILSFQQDFITIWLLYIWLTFFISFYIRKRFINQPQIIPVIISILIYSSLSILLFERVIAVICSIAVGIFIVFRGMKYAEKEIKKCLPSKLLWMIGVPLYITGYVFFLLNDRFSSHLNWLNIAGVIYIIVIVFITNKQKLEHASLSQTSPNKVNRRIQHLNRLYLVITLIILFVSSNLQSFRTLVSDSLSGAIGSLLHGRKSPGTDPTAGIEPPDMDEINIKIGDGSKEIQLPEWINHVLIILGILILIVMFTGLLAIFIQDFRSRIKSITSRIIQFFTKKATNNKKVIDETRFEDKRENVFSFKKFQHKLKENYQNTSNKIKKRKPKFEQMSTEKQIRYIYKYLASEVKHLEKWQPSLTAREVLDLSEKQIQLNQLKRWYDDIRYGNIIIDDPVAKEIQMMWQELNETNTSKKEK